MKHLLKMMLSLWLISFSGCVTYEKCAEKFGTGQDSVTVKTLATVEVPADSATVSFTSGLLDQLPIGSTISSGKGPVKASLTKTGKDAFNCEGKTEYRTITKEVAAQCPPVNNFRPDPVIIKEVPWWSWVLTGALAFLVMIQSGRLHFRPAVRPGLPEFINPPAPPAAPSGPVKSGLVSHLERRIKNLKTELQELPFGSQEYHFKSRLLQKNMSRLKELNGEIADA